MAATRWIRGKVLPTHPVNHSSTQTHTTQVFWGIMASTTTTGKDICVTLFSPGDWTSRVGVGIFRQIPLRMPPSGAAGDKNTNYPNRIMTPSRKRVPFWALLCFPFSWISLFPVSACVDKCVSARDDRWRVLWRPRHSCFTREPLKCSSVTERLQIRTKHKMCSVQIQPKSSEILMHSEMADIYRHTWDGASFGAWKVPAKIVTCSFAYDNSEALCTHRALG